MDVKTKKRRGPQHYHKKAFAPKPVIVLTPKEAELFTLVSEGHGNKEIAQAMNYTYFTAKMVVHNLMEKTGMTRLQMIALGSRRTVLAGLARSIRETPLRPGQVSISDAAMRMGNPATTGGLPCSVIQQPHTDAI